MNEMPTLCLLARSLGRISDEVRGNNERFGENVEESFPCSADCKLIVVLGKLVRWSLVQGDPYGRGIVFVDIKFTVPRQYKLLILKRNFHRGVSKNFSTTIWVTL